MSRSIALLPFLFAACAPGNNTGDSCFVAGTRVRTPTGDVPIERLRVGDAIVAFGGAVGRIAAVHRALVREVRTVIACGRTLRATPSHPFFEIGRVTFVALSELRVGDRLQGLDDDAWAITSITAEERPEPWCEVFNLTVEDAPPTYFVEGLLVHNKLLPPPCPSDAGFALSVTAPLVVCVGDRFTVASFRRDLGCADAGPEPVEATVSTTDPSIVSLDGPTGTARAPGEAHLQAEVSGVRGETLVRVTDCAKDGGS